MSYRLWEIWEGCLIFIDIWVQYLGTRWLYKASHVSSSVPLDCGGGLAPRVGVASPERANLFSLPSVPTSSPSHEEPFPFWSHCVTRSLSFPFGQGHDLFSHATTTTKPQRAPLGLAQDWSRHECMGIIQESIGYSCSSPFPQGHTNILFLFRVHDLTRSCGGRLGTSLTSARVCLCGADPIASETVPRVASPAMAPILRFHIFLELRNSNE